MSIQGKSMSVAPCKGHVHIFSDSGAGSASGFYKMTPEIPESEGSKALILGIGLSFQEIVQPTVTLDDKRTMYLFGTAWSELSVSGILLLGENKTRGEQLTKLMSWYEQNRVSKLRQPIQVSLGGAGIDAFVVGLRLDQANPQVNTQMFSIQMMTADTTP